MPGLTPADVFERFAGDLETAAEGVVQTEAVEAEARRVHATAREFLVGASETANTAAKELSGVRRTVINAIEATSEDPEDRDVLGTTMLVRGRSAAEVEQYFGHVDRIQAEEQPIAIVTTTEDVGRGAMVQVGYGLTTPAGRSNYRVQFPKTARMPDMRAVTIPVRSGRGFGTDRENQLTAIFAASPDDRRATPVIVNVDHAFDRLNFAGTADEVDAAAAAVALAERKSVADHTALDAVGMPTMVAYGEEAVLRLAEQIEGRTPRFRVYNRRSLQDLGMEAVSPLTELTLGSLEQELYTRQFRTALEELLQGMPEAESGVAFWAPLQDLVEYHPEQVLETIVGATDVYYSPSLGQVIPVNLKHPSRTVEMELSAAAKQVSRLGVAVPTAGEQIDNAAQGIRSKVVEEVLSGTPRHRFISRARIRNAE